MAFFLPLHRLPCQHPSESITWMLAQALHNTIQVLLGEGVRMSVCRHSQVLLSDVVFGGSVWTLTSKVVQFCEAPSCSSEQPHASALHVAPTFSLFPRLSFWISPPPSSCACEGSTSASCSTVTSFNPLPSVCISGDLIAPES